MTRSRDYTDPRSKHHGDAVAVLQAIMACGGTATSYQIRDRMGGVPINGVLNNLRLLGVLDRHLGPKNVRIWSIRTLPRGVTD